MLIEVRCWMSLEVTGFIIPRPPRRDGRASSSRSTSLSTDWPVMAGRNLYLMASSRGRRRSLILGIVLQRKVHLLDRP